MFLKEEVDADDVAEVVARWTGIPVSRLLEGETEKLVHMEERLHERVVGQDAAIEAVATALRRSRAGLQDPSRPIGSFLFLGPTGVGKTELARALAEFMFDSEDAMVRIDMSEYMEKHSVSRLVGAPPGYVGYEEGGQLTEAVRRRPYTVVLLDEIEKANPDVFNALLQVMDDGRLTDGQGRTVDFKNTVLIMTSNLPVGSAEVADAYDPGADARLRTELLQYFKPEFVNRLDDIVRFHALTREQIAEIVDLQVDEVIKRVAERGVQVTLTDEARQLLANMGYDPTYGARPLKRVIQKQLADRLALALLKGELREGDSVQVGRRGRRAAAADGDGAGRRRLTLLTGTRSGVPALAPPGAELRCVRPHDRIERMHSALRARDRPRRPRSLDAHLRHALHPDPRGGADRQEQPAAHPGGQQGGRAARRGRKGPVGNARPRGLHLDRRGARRGHDGARVAGARLARHRPL